MLDRLPAWARHAAIIAGGAFLGSVGRAIVNAGGVTALDWTSVLASALDFAAVSVVLGMGVLSLTPASRQYGVGR